MNLADKMVEHQGTRMRLKEAAHEAGFAWHVVYSRIKNLGWSVERALSESINIPGQPAQADPMIDQRFGRLHVFNRMKPCDYGYGAGAHYLCVCDCGQAIGVRGVDLRRGDTKSCGCLRRDTARATRARNGIATRFSSDRQPRRDNSNRASNRSCLPD